MIETPSYTLQLYGLTPFNGFLPNVPPLKRLPQLCYEPWESLMDELPAMITRRTIRQQIDVLPILDTSFLDEEAEWRRAYLILSFLTHGYIWGGEKPSSRLPPSITAPFLEVANYHGLPTTATYAALNLWNHTPVYHGADLSVPENVNILHTFTGTSDEAWFYLISVSIEAKGAPIIPQMLECFEAVRAEDSEMVQNCLRRIKHCIDDMGNILDRMHEQCDPQIFYHRIRPFLAGSKGMVAAGLPHGVFYDEGNGKGRWRQYSGGSNAQSSLIQLLDIMLGIEHYATGKSVSDSSAPTLKAKHSYIQEMRNYMPGPHRHFLSHICHISNIREYILENSSDVDLCASYQQVVKSLTSFRDKHIQIVSRYIIGPSRKLSQFSQSKNESIVPTIRADGSQSGDAQSKLCGTGGTMLMPFLKQTRDETRNASDLAKEWIG